MTGKKESMEQKPKDEKNGKLLSVSEATQYLGISKPTLYRLLEQDKLKAHKVGNQWRFRKADLAAYVERGPVAAAVADIPMDLLQKEIDFIDAEFKRAGRDPLPQTKHDDLSVQEQKLTELTGKIIKLSYLLRASDIHVESYRTGNVAEEILRFRIDGIMKETRRLPHQVGLNIIALLKRWMCLDAEVRRPQDGRIQIKFDEQIIDLRGSVIPTIFGDSLVLRLLDAGSLILGLDKIGLSAQDIEAVRRLGKSNAGLFIATGPSGSGKTTLLYSMLQEISTPDIKTIALEEPVEVAIPWATQSQISSSVGYTFPAAVRAALRQDPDVILVGELRERETLSACVQAAATGHFVLTGFFAVNAFAALQQMSEMGIEPFLISNSLRGIVGQRLVRKVCQKCRVAQPLPEKVYEELREPALKAGFDISPKMLFYSAKGCEFCHKNGYKGRTGVFEILEFKPYLQNAFHQGLLAEDLQAIAVKHGMKTILADALRKAVEGETSIEEVFRIFDMGKFAKSSAQK